MSLFERLILLIHEGSLPVMIPLIGVCLGLGIYIVDRVLYLYEPRTWLAFFWPAEKKRLGKVRHTIAAVFDSYLRNPKPKRLRKLVGLCGQYRTPYTRFLLRVLKYDWAKKSDLIDLRISKASLDEEISIENSFAMLSTFSKVAPLVGLLGTVTGMIFTFKGMMGSSTSDPRSLSAGISIALIATNVGLVVGLPGVIGMALLSKRARTLDQEIRVASMRINAAFTGGEEIK